MKIVIAIDGSEESVRIVRPAAELARATGADVALIRVLTTRDSGVDPGTVQKEMEATLRLHDLTGETHVLTSDGKDVAAAIAGFAEETGAGLIAIARHGHGMLRKAIMGSVTEAVLGRANCPVMVSGTRAEDLNPGETFHVVATFDGSEASRAAIAKAGVLNAPRARVRVTLVRAYSPVSDPEMDADDREKLLAELREVAETLPVSFSVEAKVLAVAPGERLEDAIVDAAVKLQADAVWMGTHGHSMRSRVLAGSIALAVVERSPVPVVLVRE